jgi:hypothetical protein
MMNNETNDLMQYLSQIARNSNYGEIPWNQTNLSTFEWMQTSAEDHFHVTIQKVVDPTLRELAASLSNEPDAIYLFQVQDRRTEQTIISLSTKERPEIYDELAEIFHGAEKGMDVRAGNILRRLLAE